MPKSAPVRTPKQPSYLDLEAQWHKRQADFVEATWLRMMRDQSMLPLYCYVKPSEGPIFGELIAVADEQDPPAGYEIATAERIPPTDRQGIGRWLARFAGRLPVMPVYPTVQA